MSDVIKAAMNEDVLLCLILLENKDNLHARSEEGFSLSLIVCKYGLVDVLERMIELGLNVNEDTGSDSLLHVAVEYNQFDCVEVLVKHGARLSVCNKARETALSVATYYSRANMVKILLEAGSDINTQNRQWWTPLHFAAYRNDAECTRLLLSKGADVNKRTSSGYTALDVAMRENSHQVTKMLTHAKNYI